MLHIKFQASKPSGSEEEDFCIYFYAFRWFTPRTPWPMAILDPGTFMVQDHLAMLHTKFQALEPNDSEEEDI